MENKEEGRDISCHGAVSQFPGRVVLELTAKCNLSCPMCPRNYVRIDNGFMSRDLWETLVDEIYRESPESIILPFWRGESLLHPAFAAFIGYALDKSLKIHLSTNGQVLRKEDAEALLKCEFITFSIHTAPGYKNAKKFLSMRKGMAPAVQISFVRGEETEEIYNMITGMPGLDGFDSVRLYDEHTMDGVFGRSGRTHDIPRTFCPKLDDTLVIAYDGSISRCNHIWETEERIDIHNMSIKELWHSDILKNIREDYPDKRCAACDQWTGHTCGELWRTANGKVEHRKYGPAGITRE
jgi:radical SAM protein with 4Fe4S-binding SPASM domain